MIFFNTDSNFSNNKPSAFDTTKPFKNIQLGTVVSVGKVQVNGEDENAARRDKRFNADTHAIRVRIIGAKYDNRVDNKELANCFPLLPRHINFVPKVNEVVMVMVFGEDEKFGDRFYIGPLISDETKLNLDTVDGTAKANLANGTTSPGVEISSVPTAIGIYDDPHNVIIEGRNNTDIIQREGEILLRAGKFRPNEPLKFNSKDPAYFQIKHNVAVSVNETKTTDIISVANLVASRINLLTYNTPNYDGDTYDLTHVDANVPVADYITEDELSRIVNSAHPAVFGDTLVRYLQLLKDALFQHVHNGNGNELTDRTDRGTLAVEDFLKEAEDLENKMLSKNIRIN